MNLDSIIANVMTERAVTDGVGFASNDYSPHSPTVRQQLFLNLNDEREVFYGGAAGGGKSDALLMAAIEYVDVPGYAALILRQSYADLAQPGALMDRAHAWFSQSGAHWSGETKTWTFPGGGRIRFGYMEAENDKLQFQSAEFQYVGFDEVTHFTKTQYLYLFSRLRRLEGSDVPIRMRAASNPPHDARGMWVKDHFVPKGFRPEMANEPRVFEIEYRDEETGQVKKRFFVPAKIEDNPHLDREEYRASLSHLDAVTRAQLLRGDWQITVQGDILFDWQEDRLVVPWSQFMRVLHLKKKQVPVHWRVGVWQDWGATLEHPCVTGWFARAAENCPPVTFKYQNGDVAHRIPLAGSVFWYRTHIKTLGNTARKMKADMMRYMVPTNEVRRCDTWEMSHEALSERNEYNEPDDVSGISLPFTNWEAGYTRGIEQLKSAIAPVGVDEPHPFNPGVWGRQKLYVLVDDEQMISPDEVTDGQDKGQYRIRAEAPSYKWDVPKSGETPKKLVPYPLFNDACDIARAAAASLFPEVQERTAQEELERRVKARMPGLQDLPRSSTIQPKEGTQIATAIVRAQELKKMREEYDLDDLGLENENPGDFTQGW